MSAVRKVTINGLPLVGNAHQSVRTIFPKVAEIGPIATQRKSPGEKKPPGAWSGGFQR
jgi:hypothetical protein